jgi:HD-like signal output (HDOD) protein
MTTKVLFVDDEANILSGLRRLLRGQRDEWDMDFVSSGNEALEILRCKSVDVIVTDMRMPSMSGAELLQQVRLVSPQTVRLVLSGQSEQENLLRSIGPAHQYLSKPCDAGLLINTIRRTCHLQSRLQDESLKRVVAQISFLPMLPNLYRRLVEELNSDSVSMDQIGELIGSDLSLSAKVLQLVNSSFFGLAQHVSSPKHAAALLGLNVIRPLILFAGVSSQCEELGLGAYSLRSSTEHSLSVAVHSRKIAVYEGLDSYSIDDAFIAGMMHDLGKLILVANLKKEYEEILKTACVTNVPLWQCEQTLLGTTHAEVGAYLLGLWGFSNSVVEAVAFHHQPTNGSSLLVTPLTVVHFANGYQYQKSQAGFEGKGNESLDHDYLLASLTRDRLAQWGKLQSS